MTDDHVYLSLAAEHPGDDARWAFGTGFEDPLHGVDTALPEGDTAALAAACLALGDDALVSAQRLGEWCARAPELEEELALANIGLDLLGQARLLYARAGRLDGTGRDEDAYAYLRGPEEFRNLRLAELPNGDFAFTVVRMLLLSCRRHALFRRLAAGAADPVLRAVAAKGVKELAYHREYAASWAVRLGDGTAESRRRMEQALDAAAPYVAELFAADRTDLAAAGLPAAAPVPDASDGPDTAAAAEPEPRAEALDALEQVLAAAGLRLPEAAQLPGGGRAGEHTEHLAPLLAELQSVARAHPGATW